MTPPRTDEAAADLMQCALAGGLTPLRLGGRSLLPVVQGGMGVGISAHRLAGSVAALGAVGTISSVDLRRHHPDLMERTRELPVGEAATQAAKVAINAANLEALEREIRAARVLSGGRGLLAVNVMRAVGEYAPSVTRALECGIDAVVVGAGLPLDLPDLAQDHPQALLVPILSDARGVQLPARAVATPWLKNYLKAESRLQAVVHVKPRCTLAFDCLAQCGLRDGLAGWGQFCIDTQLAAALRGDVKKGLFFRGVGALPFGQQIRSVRELLQALLSDARPALQRDLSGQVLMPSSV